MAPKRERDASQLTLEETPKVPATAKKRSKKDAKAAKATDTATDDLVAAKLAKKHAAEPAFQKEHSQKRSYKAEGAQGDNPEYVTINRAPVLTFWVAVVAQRQGYSRKASLTFGKAIAGLLAQSKGRRIGVFEKNEKDEQAKLKKQEQEAAAGVSHADVFGMSIKVLEVDGEPLALDSATGKAVEATRVEQYLKRAFGDRLGDVEGALKELADSYSKEAIGAEAYHLYEQFRPEVASGTQGWGRKGRLEFARITELKET